MNQIHSVPVIVKKWKWSGKEEFLLDTIYVFVGSNIPQNISNDLSQFEAKFVKNYTNSNLDKFFGKGFVDNITSILKVQGGDSNDISFDELMGPIEEVDISADEIIPDDDAPIKENISLHKILAQKISEAPQTNEIFVPKKAATQTIQDVKLKFISETVWSIDTPMDLRKKIWTATNIPLPYQHILLNKNPFLYSIYNNNKLVNIALTDILSSPDKYNDIPIINHYYAYRDFFMIKSMDNFNILENIIHNNFVLDLYDAQDFLSKLDDKKIDKNTQQLIYYGFFILFWPMITLNIFEEWFSDSNLVSMYPELFPNKENLKETYKWEVNILGSLNINDPKVSKIVQEIEKNIYIRIQKSNILNFSYGENKMVILSLRNIFDNYELSNKLIAMKYCFFYEGKRLVLNKIYKNTKDIKAIIPMNCLIMRIVSTISEKDNTYNTFDLYLYENGNYMVKCAWAETSSYSFDQGIKIAANAVNEVLTRINKWKNLAINQNYYISLVSPTTIKFSNISAEIYYRQSLNRNEVSLCKYILADMVRADILSPNKNITESNTYNYYMIKANYQQDETILTKKVFNITNMYEYLSNETINTKWNQIYKQNKFVSVYIQPSDIRFVLTGLWDNEFNIFYGYVVLLIYNMKLNKTIHEVSKKVEEPNIIIDKRNIKSLKQNDPVLYDFKRYGSNIIYSTICQKPNQPQIMSKHEYDKLDKKEKHKVIKYWNFTTQSPTYYYPPNPKYPYINFITGKHPKGFCIPCAKKTPSFTKNNIKRAIYESCMKDHKYMKEMKNIITDTRYIMNYGKYIDSGRLCKLPENTLEPLFYESYSEINGIDEECYRNDKFFLLGIEQNWGDIPSVGFIYILMSCLDLTEVELYEQIKNALENNPTMFNILLDGVIFKYFYSYCEFLDTINKIITARTLDSDLLDIPWNDIFIDIAFYYFNIVTIEFRDFRNVQTKSKYEMKREEVDEVVAGDNIEMNISHKLNVLSALDSNYKYIITLRRGTCINPIYLINPVIFFKTKVIGKKLFESSDHIMSIISKVINTNKETQTDNVYSYYTTLESITKYLEYRNISILEYYINAHNQCYYIKISNNIYLPVMLTNWTVKKDVKIMYTPPKINMTFKALNGFLEDYNKWIVKNYKDNSAGIILEKWIGLGKLVRNTICPQKIIGFVFSGINYYFNDISLDTAKKIKSAPIWTLLHSPSIINDKLYKKTPPEKDKLTSNLAQSFYEHYIYKLLVLEYSVYFGKERNSKIRVSIKKLLATHKSDTELIKLFTKIRELLTEYYDKNEAYIKEDFSKIIEIINKHTIQGMDKNSIYKDIDTTSFIFDNVSINNFITMDEKDIKASLIKIGKNIVSFGKPPNSNVITNILLPCNTNSAAYYCRSNKLIIEEKKFKQMLDILVMDIKNPLKQKWLFSAIINDTVIKFLRFIRRPLEHISIEIN